MESRFGWVGDSRTWELDTGALSSRLIREQNQQHEYGYHLMSVQKFTCAQPGAEWAVCDFDVLVHKDAENGHLRHNRGPCCALRGGIKVGIFYVHLFKISLKINIFGHNMKARGGHKS
ncbi:nucleotide-diphospho-sugar transferase superfamily protein [Striga asiatica]|uniref:Nucleotide-diphospho-sugar transferase superfamily protein n=1 Tax=Striga asiatica TaxID=4170 RepID=A0A5A7P9T7_STRAF|nr:nucleotide-diphospho-sugar transferase superfamily protein [Striga asiatica]